MSCVLLPGLGNQQTAMRMVSAAGSGASTLAINSLGSSLSYWRSICATTTTWKSPISLSSSLRSSAKRMSFGVSPMASGVTKSPSVAKAEIYKKVLEDARDKFTQEISFQSKDKDISLAKALLYVAAEDEAFLAYNREVDAHSMHIERENALPLSDFQEWQGVEDMPISGKNLNKWLAELDVIAKEVAAELVSREIGCHFVEVVEAVNRVLFEFRGFKRLPVLVDSKYSYLHSALSSGCASGILLSVIYIEVCQRLNLVIVGSRVGEDFLIWPQTGNPEELFKVTSGHSLFGVVNGKCVDDPRCRASDITSNSLLGLDIATNRDIIGIALANLVRLYWKRASRKHYGLMLTSPLRSTYNDGKFNSSNSACLPLLRSQELRLAIMASERFLILQPHDWTMRRDHGMMLYYNREYEAAVQELSICMAFAPEEEAEVLEPFVEKLHLMRLEASWKSFEPKGTVNLPLNLN
ncbi:uncharacterized protein LOC127243618 isoform X2 [Andrographis paniculata]|uniref:uncharacterized protein LOC127243618 isoform X2 n=1 Tax=Andrographis paniculata TaxID=175694 RepID=UPI0021E8CA5E|nr:uncharacterized protein LOC127243618 isoform X2 [Andrographis paniculata]